MNFLEKVQAFKDSGKGLMSTAQYLNVAEVVNILAPCNFLIFGLGEDSYLWQDLNAGGRTVFLEDDKEWSSKFSESSLEIHNVEYNTRVEDHEKIGFDENLLELNLPKTIRNTSWDIIFVDGPLSHNPPRPYKGPGRMSSMYEASRLLKKDGILIADDMGRLVEGKYSIHYFGQKNLWKVIENKVGFFKKAQ